MCQSRNSACTTQKCPHPYTSPARGVTKAGHTTGKSRGSYLIIAWRAKRSQAPMLKMPVLSLDRLRTRANRLTVRWPLMGTVLTKVVKLRPFPKVKEMTLVLGNKACAVTFTMGTCSMYTPQLPLGLLWHQVLLDYMQASIINCSTFTSV